MEKMSRSDMLRAEAHLVEDAQECLTKCLALLNSLVLTMRDRKAAEKGNEPYRKDSYFMYGYDENFIEHDVADLVNSARYELSKVRVPEK